MGSIAAASSNSDLVGSENRLLPTFGTVTPVPGPRKQADHTDWRRAWSRLPTRHDRASPAEVVTTTHAKTHTVQADA